MPPNWRCDRYVQLLPNPPQHNQCHRVWFSLSSTQGSCSITSALTSFVHVCNFYRLPIYATTHDFGVPATFVVCTVIVYPPSAILAVDTSPMQKSRQRQVRKKNSTVICVEQHEDEGWCVGWQGRNDAVVSPSMLPHTESKQVQLQRAFRGSETSQTYHTHTHTHICMHCCS